MRRRYVDTNSRERWSFLDGFICGLVRKEGVLSFQIEGTQATLVDLLHFEAEVHEGPSENADLREVCNYLTARDEIEIGGPSVTMSHE